MFQVYLRQYLIKLKMTSLYRLLQNNLFLIVISVSILFLSLHEYLYLIIYGIFFVYIYQENKCFFKVLLIINLFIFVLFILHTHTLPQFNNDISYGEGKVIQIDYFEDYQKIIIKDKNKKIILYDSYTIDLNVGSIIKFYGTPQKVYSKRVFDGFDYQKYLQRKKIIGIVSVEKIEVIAHQFDYRFLRQIIYQYLHKNFSKDSYSFLQGILLGDTSLFDEMFFNSLIEIGVIHLFSISGLHIQLFINLLVSFLEKIRLNKKQINIGVITLLMFYLTITSWTPSVLRASLMYLLNQANKKYFLQLSSLDIVSIVFLILIIINPLYIYQYGFLLSFSASIIVILSSKLVSKYSNTIQVLLMSWLIQILSFPLVVNLHPNYNLISPFVNVIYIYIVSTFIIPFSILVMVFPILDPIFSLLINNFIKVTIWINSIFSLRLSFPKFLSIEVILYLGTIYYIIKFFLYKSFRRFFICLFLGVFLVISNRLTFDPYGRIYFLDLHHGESIIIKEPFNNCNVVIDTGDGKNNVVTSFLKNKGFKRIDYLILTHNHVDHNGESIDIITNFKVDNIVVHYYDQSIIARQYSNIRVKEGDVINCGNLSFQVLNPSKNNLDENDNSIILYTTINNTSFLFTGDATTEIERELITKYNLRVDILKVGHHGSSTSTSPDFINAIRPQYAVIMNGTVEKFGFPHPEVLSILRNFQVTTLTTKQYNSIEYRYFYNREGIFYGLNGRI